VSIISVKSMVLFSFQVATATKSQRFDNTMDFLIAKLDASSLRAEFTQTPRDVPTLNSPEVFAQITCTDPMITTSWKEERLNTKSDWMISRGAK
jgi:hypothetical protein